MKPFNFKLYVGNDGKYHVINECESVLPTNNISGGNIEGVKEPPVRQKGKKKYLLMDIQKRV